jgi:hypothetical protein
MHIVEAVVDFGERTLVGDVFVNLHLTLQVIWRTLDTSYPGKCKHTINKLRKFRTALDPTKGRSTPSTASDKLESDMKERHDYQYYWMKSHMLTVG